MSESNVDNIRRRSNPRDHTALRKSEQTRKAILDAAQEFLWSHRFRELTAKDDSYFDLRFAPELTEGVPESNWVQTIPEKVGSRCPVFTLLLNLFLTKDDAGMISSEWIDHLCLIETVFSIQLD